MQRTYRTHARCISWVICLGCVISIALCISAGCVAAFSQAEVQGEHSHFFQMLLGISRQPSCPAVQGDSAVGQWRAASHRAATAALEQLYACSTLCPVPDPVNTTFFVDTVGCNADCISSPLPQHHTDPICHPISDSNSFVNPDSQSKSDSARPCTQCIIESLAPGPNPAPACAPASQLPSCSLTCSG